MYIYLLKLVVDRFPKYFTTRQRRYIQRLVTCVYRYCYYNHSYELYNYKDLMHAILMQTLLVHVVINLLQVLTVFGIFGFNCCLNIWWFTYSTRQQSSLITEILLKQIRALLNDANILGWMTARNFEYAMIFLSPETSSI